MDINKLEKGRAVNYFNTEDSVILTGIIKAFDNERINIIDIDTNQEYIKPISEVKFLEYLDTYENTDPIKKGGVVLLAALDIGITTGYAIAQIKNNILSIKDLGVLPYDYMAMSTFVNTNSGVNHFIFEEFRSNVMNSTQKQVIEMLGIFKFLCKVNLITPYAQYPQQRQGYIKVAKEIVKALNRNIVSHEIDALAHICRFADKVCENVSFEVEK